MSDIAANIQNIRDTIILSAREAGRDHRDVKLVAVTKTVQPKYISEAVRCGIDILGENKVQEAMEKINELPDNISWHMIGHLQTNKVKYTDIFTLIHSVDSINLAREIDKRGKLVNKVKNVLIQVNLSEEDSKFGMDTKGVFDLIKNISVLKYISIKGLMTIPPFSTDPEDSRIFFKRLKSLSDEIKMAGIPNVSMDELSMGMSNDYHIAVSEGATMVRVGSKIFGEREYAK